MVVVERDADEVATVWCDPCIEQVVRALNTNGLRTIASCCGHGTHPTSVLLSDGRTVLVVDDATASRVYDLLGLGGYAGHSLNRPADEGGASDV